MRGLVLGFCGLLFAAPFVGCDSQPATKRFIFLINTPDPYWDTCNAGLKEGAKEFDLAGSGLSITMEPNTNKLQGQIDKLRQYATQSDVVGIAISPFEADALALVEEMRKLQKKGVKVICVDADVNFKDARPYYIGTNNKIAGENLGKATQAILKAKGVDKGGYVQFVGSTDNFNAKLRMDGFKEGVGSDYEELDRMPDGGGDITKAQTNVQNAIINQKEKLNCLVGIWAYNGPAIATVVKELGKRDQYVSVTFDAAVDSIKTMENGGIDCLCVQQPFDMGLQAVRLLKAMHLNDEATLKEMFPNHGQPDGDVFTTGLRIVVPDEKSPVKSDLFDKNVVEFMTLPAFKEWLKKYKLTSS